MFFVPTSPRLATISALTLTVSAIAIDQVQATTLIGNVVTTTGSPSEIDLCADNGLCFPGASISLDTNAPARIVNNDTGFAITDILYTIAPEQDAVWDLAISESDIFDITIFNNGTQMLLHNGAIAENQVVFADRLALPQSPTDPDPVNFSFTINSGVTVPEPSLTFGLIGLSFLGVSKKLLLNRIR
jgi:hypothetical protein